MLTKNHQTKMTLTNRIPNRLFGNLDEFFNQAFRSFGPNPVSRVPDSYRYETDKHYRLRLDLPGFTKKEIKLTLEDGQLKISAKTESEDAFRSDFDRVFDLPDDANAGEVTAKLEDGVLDLVINKVAESVPAVRTIKIK
jgi:HSP20 family protein